VLAGARMATTQILDDLKMPIPKQWEVSASELATHRTLRDAAGGATLLAALTLLIAIIVALYSRR
jgi:phytoene desaturase (3,4-didehydrolycopene-forming)